MPGVMLRTKSGQLVHKHIPRAAYAPYEYNDCAWIHRPQIIQKCQAEYCGGIAELC